MLQKKIRLGDLLVEKGLITEKQVEEAFAEQKASGNMKKFGQILIEKEFVDEEKMLRALAEQLEVEFLMPGTIEFDVKTAGKIPLNVLKRIMAVPFRDTTEDEQDTDVIDVLFADPLDLDAQDTIQRMLPNLPIRVNITTSTEIAKLISRLESFESLKDTLADVRREIEGGTQVREEESAIMRLIEIVVTSAIRRKASDIHIEPSKLECHVRARIDGFLEEIYTFPADIFPPLASRVKLLGNIDIAERRKPQDGRFSMTVDETEYDFRLSTLPVHLGESVVMRILDKTKVLIKLDEIGFDQTNTAKFRNAMNTPHGIIFVTGPTGSGKTTTLYAGLNEIKNVNRKIITVEDPIEYQMNLIQQVQVNEKADLTFANALRSILRQDPDIIMVGEARDKDTLAIAVQAALTGHLVFTTLHTNDAVSAVTRIVDMGIEPFLVASSIIAIQAQRLVRKVCPYCQSECHLPEAVFNTIRPYLKTELPRTFTKGRGCKKCNMTGYIGRTIISEVFEFNDAVAMAVAKGANKQELLQIAMENGFEPMFTDGMQKAAQGITTVEEVMRVAKL